MNINGYELVQTCGACPEQYDVHKDGENVAYLRLRHGSFRADCPYGGETVYSSNPVGDGIFEDNERMIHLEAAIKAIDAKLKEREKEMEEYWKG